MAGGRKSIRNKSNLIDRAHFTVPSLSGHLMLNLQLITQKDI